MKSLEQMAIWEKQESIERDCIAEFKEIWSAAAPPERQTIRDMVVTGEREAPGRCPYIKIVALYHEILPMLRRVKIDTTSRRSHVSARWNDMPTLTEWDAYFRLVSRCPHLVGQGDTWNGRVWKADFDWLINPQNFAKVVEGKYGI